MKIAYYLNTDIQHFPPIYCLYPHFKGYVYTKKKKIFDFVKEKYPEVEIRLFCKNIDIRKDIIKKEIRLVIYPSFNNIAIGKGVQIFHGGFSDKDYDSHPLITLYDLACFPGQKIVSKIEKAGYLHKIPKWKIVGYPKFDHLINNKIEPIKLFNNQQKTILYAPTWVSQTTKIRFKFSKYGESSLPVFGLDIIKEIGKKYNLIIKFHNRIYREPNDIFEQIEQLAQTAEFKDSVKCVWDDNILPYMATSDIMISDISAVCYEWLHFNKPIIFANPAPKYYKPSSDMFSSTYAWNAGDVIYEKSDIAKLVSKNLTQDDYQQAREKIFTEALYKPDGKATKREIAAIEELYEEVSKIPYSKYIRGTILKAKYKKTKLSLYFLYQRLFFNKKL